MSERLPVDKLTLLRAGRALIADEKRWIKGQYAVNENGYDSIDPLSAAGLCSVGALWGAQVAHSATDGEMIEARRALDARVPITINDTPIPVINYNDRPRTTHEEILRVWDDAIALEEEKQTGAALPPIEAPVETKELELV